MSRGDLWRKYQYKQPLEEAGKHTGRSVNERGTVKDRPVDNNEGSVGSSSPRYSPIADSVSKMDELIDTVEIVEIVDGVRVRLTAGPSVIEMEAVSD